MYSTSRGVPSGLNSWRVPTCSNFVEKSLPALRNQGLYRRHCKIIQPAADDFFARKAQELAGAETGLLVIAIVVRDKNGRGRMEDNRTEQGFEFLRAVFREPTGG